MDFDKVCTIFTMQEPYYGILLSAMDRFPTHRVSTMGVLRSGNVFRLLYNPDFVADKSLEQMMAYLKHETLHVAFNHFTIFGEPPKNQMEQTMQNIACDLEVNSYVNFPASDLELWNFPRSYGWDERLGTMEYYRRLEKMQEESRKRHQQIEEERRNQEKTQKQPENNNGNQEEAEVKEKKNIFEGLTDIQKKVVFKNRKERKSIPQIAVELGMTEDEIKDALIEGRRKVKQNMT